jgi:hypothetical protein
MIKGVVAYILLGPIELITISTVCAHRGPPTLDRRRPQSPVLHGGQPLSTLVLPFVWAPRCSSGTLRGALPVDPPSEFRRVLDAAVLLPAAVATVSWGLDLDVARGFVVVALPPATVLTVAVRLLQRQWLRR